MVVATCVESGGNIAGNVFLEIICCDAINERVSVHVTQLKVCAILGLYVVIIKLIHNDLTQIEDGLLEIDRFVHDDSDLSHLAPHQVLAEDNEVRGHHLP